MGGLPLSSPRGGQGGPAAAVWASPVAQARGRARGSARSPGEAPGRGTGAALGWGGGSVCNTRRCGWRARAVGPCVFCDALSPPAWCGQPRDSLVTLALGLSASRRALPCGGCRKGTPRSSPSPQLLRPPCDGPVFLRQKVALENMCVPPCARRGLTRRGKGKRRKKSAPTRGRSGDLNLTKVALLPLSYESCSCCHRCQIIHPSSAKFACRAPRPLPTGPAVGVQSKCHGRCPASNSETMPLTLGRPQSSPPPPPWCAGDPHPGGRTPSLTHRQALLPCMRR